MAILSFKLDQIFILPVPGLVGLVGLVGLPFVVACCMSFPNEPNIVQKSLSIKSKFVIGVAYPLHPNPIPKSHVFLVPLWNESMSIRLFKLDKLFILLIPLFISKYRHGSFRFVAV
jgi:hypothetical protein